MAVLEREGRFSSFSSSSSSSSSSYPAPAPSNNATTTTEAAPSPGRVGGWWNPPEVGVGFRRFVAAVRAVLLFEGEGVSALDFAGGGGGGR